MIALIPKGNVIKYILLKIDPTCSLEIEVSEQYIDNDVEGKMNTVIMAIIRPSTQEPPINEKYETDSISLPIAKKKKRKTDMMPHRSNS